MAQEIMQLRDWSTEERGLVRPAFVQPRGRGCRFAAISRFIDYMLRIVYTAFPHPGPIKLIDRDLVDPERMKTLYGDRGKKLSELLQYLETRGAELWNGRIYKLQEHLPVTFASEYDTNEGRRVIDEFTEEYKITTLNEWFNDGVVLGSIGIFKDYKVNHPGVYTRGDGLMRGSHTVVILGLKRIDGIVCFTYQESHGNEGRFGNGLNAAQINVILKVYKVSFEVPNELLAARF